MDWNQIVDVTQKIVTILAVSLGGVGAYYKFIRGRIFRPRLQLEVEGKVIRDGEINCLLVNAAIKNVGTSTIPINREGTCVAIFRYGKDEYYPEPHEALWQHLETFRIFEGVRLSESVEEKKKRWIESGEQTKDALLIPLSGERQVAFRLDMIVNARGISFHTRSIVEWQPTSEKQQPRKDDGNEPNEKQL